MAALDGAFAFAQVDDIAVFVAQDLNLDVTRAFDEFLDIDRRVAEGRLGFGGGHGEGRAHLFARANDAHAFSAAARRSFEHHRIADLGGELSGRYLIGQRFGRAGTIGAPALTAATRALVLSPINSIDCRGRADEFDSGLADGAGEPFALREEAIAGVNRLRARFESRLDDLFAGQITLRRGRFADEVGLVGQADVQRLAVGLGVDDDRRDPQVAAGANQPHRDLTSIGDQDFAKHRGNGEWAVGSGEWEKTFPTPHSPLPIPLWHNRNSRLLRIEPDKDARAGRVGVFARQLFAG